MRKSLLDIAREIHKLLSENKELSIHTIAVSIGSQWATTLKVLEFLKEFDIVKERYGKESYKKERLFRLK